MTVLAGRSLDSKGDATAAGTSIAKHGTSQSRSLPENLLSSPGS